MRFIFKPGQQAQTLQDHINDLDNAIMDKERAVRSTRRRVRELEDTLSAFYLRRSQLINKLRHSRGEEA